MVGEIHVWLAVQQCAPIESHARAGAIETNLSVYLKTICFIRLFQHATMCNNIVLQEKSEIVYPLILLVRLFPLFEQANQPIVI